MKKIALLVISLFFSYNSYAVTATNIADLVPEIIPAVVNISTTQKIMTKGGGVNPMFPQGSPFEEFNEFFERFGMVPGWEGDEENPRNAMSLGTGFIVDGEGYIVTNFHVIQNSEEITVTLNDNTKYQAEIIGSDNKTDLALLKIKDNKGKKFPSVKFGDSDKSRIGDWVVTIGNPFGLGNTVTSGIISARGRDLHAGNYDDFIQTDAAINKGNSGGPMFNLDGEVIGINTAIYSPTGGSVGIGFAIPSKMAEPIIQQIKDTGSVKRGWLGIVIQPVTKEIAESLKYEGEDGALVVELDPKGPASKAGIKEKDIIVKFNNALVTSNRSLPRMVVQTPIGSKAEVELIRDGKHKTISVKVEEYPEADNELKESYKGSMPKEKQSKVMNTFGFAVSDLNKDIKNQLGINENVKGVFISNIKRGSLAHRSGMMRGDVIVEVNQEATPDSNSFYKVLDNALSKKASSTLFVILRKNQKIMIGVGLR
ncbi:MAG: hypothetical protein BGO27_01630 [Alphaproteobacteria bacterium 33-17]|nr:MAG: hypothetical protein BGO27_01630 [Alphaproteobacteria bacterium 33-17]